MAVESIFAKSGQGIFDDTRDETGNPFQAVTGIDTTLSSTLGDESKFKDQKFGFDKSIKKSEQEAQAKTAALTAKGTSGLLSGLQIGGQETGSESITSADSIIQILGGVGAGALAGGVPGAVAGGLAAGLSVFLGTRANKRKSKDLKAKEARYQKMVQEQIKREDAFRKQERDDRLELQGFDRRRNKMADQWKAYGLFSKQITNTINQNEDLKLRFAKEGF